MAEYLNVYISSLFTRNNINSLPVPDIKFQEATSKYLGQILVTPEMVTNKIKAIKDNTSPRVNGIPSKLIMEIVEQITFVYYLQECSTCH